MYTNFVLLIGRQQYLPNILLQTINAILQRCVKLCAVFFWNTLSRMSCRNFCRHILTSLHCSYWYVDMMPTSLYSQRCWRRSRIRIIHVAYIRVTGELPTGTCTRVVAGKSINNTANAIL